MTDPIQASSSNPLPGYQTLKGTQDPLPMSSPRALNQSTTARALDEAAGKADAFKSYLDQTSVTVVEKSKPKSAADTADLIAERSVYGQPGVSTPF